MDQALKVRDSASRAEGRLEITAERAAKAFISQHSVMMLLLGIISAVSGMWVWMQTKKYRK